MAPHSHHHHYRQTPTTGPPDAKGKRVYRQALSTGQIARNDKVVCLAAFTASRWQHQVGTSHRVPSGSLPSAFVNANAPSGGHEHREPLRAVEPNVAQAGSGHGSFK